MNCIILRSIFVSTVVMCSVCILASLLCPKEIYPRENQLGNPNFRHATINIGNRVKNHKPLIMSLYLYASIKTIKFCLTEKLFLKHEHQNLA